MLKMFDPEVDTDTEKNIALLELTKKGFFPLLSTEVGLFHHVIMTLLTNINPKNANFDYEYNQILFGGMLIELAMETDKCYASNKEELYAKTVDELRDLCDIQEFPHPIAMWHPNDLSVNISCIMLIRRVGQRILNCSLEFSNQHLDAHFGKSSQYLHNHHPHNPKHKNEHHDNMIALHHLLNERHKKFTPTSSRFTQ